MLQQIETRIAQLTRELEQAVANHNVIFGALSEAKNMLASLQAGATEVANVAANVEDAVTKVETCLSEGEQNGTQASQ